MIYSGVSETILIHTHSPGLIINSTYFNQKRMVICTVNYIVTLSVVRLSGLSSGPALRAMLQFLHIK